MQKLQTQNVETIRLNKEMILKFNNPFNNLKHNEEVLNTQINELKDVVKIFITGEVFQRQKTL